MCDLKRCRSSAEDIGYQIGSTVYWLCWRSWEQVCKKGIVLTRSCFKRRSR